MFLGVKLAWLRFFLASFVLLFILGQLAKLPGDYLYLCDLVLFFLLGIWFAWLAFNWPRIRTMPFPRLLLLGAVFLVWCLLTILFSYLNFGGVVFSQGLLYWIRWLVYFFLFPIAYTVTLASSKNRNFIYSLILVSGVLLATFGFIQLAIFPDLTFLALSEGWDPHKNRLVSTFFDPNFTGAYLSLCFLLALPRFLHKPARLYFFILSVLGLAILLTFSRSAWALLAVGLLVIGVMRYRWLLATGFILFLMVYWLVPRVQTRLSGLTDPADSASYRLVSWSKAWEVYQQYPWRGTGFGNFRLAQKEAGYFDPGEWGGHSGAGSDSSLLLVLATTGPVGLLLFLLIYGPFVKESLNWARFERDPELALSLLAILAGLAVESFFINSLFYPAIMALVWMIGGNFLAIRCSRLPV